MKIKIWTLILLAFLLGITLTLFLIFKSFDFAIIFFASHILADVIVFVMLRNAYRSEIKETKQKKD